NVDNGATAVFLHEQFAKQYRIPTFLLEKPRLLSLADDSFADRILHAALVDLRIGNHQEQVLAFVTKLA
ncbi:hypothetical protein K402DRAFT_313707, partial [Aulographum hederae CBS 113979]